MDRTCTYEGCTKPLKGRGLCETHRKRLQRHGDPSVVKVKQPMPLKKRERCRIDGCDKLLVGDGLCRNHYMRRRRRGSATAENLPKGNFSTPVNTRLHMYEKLENGCWQWTGYVNKNGYGVVGSKGSVVLAHRAMYEELVGPIPEGLTLDHLCGNITCVYPEHLDPCTRRENLFRGGRPHFELRGKAAGYS